jgi:hypothetical protein
MPLHDDFKLHWLIIIGDARHLHIPLSMIDGLGGRWKRTFNELLEEAYIDKAISKTRSPDMYVLTKLGKGALAESHRENGLKM